MHTVVTDFGTFTLPHHQFIPNYLAQHGVWEREIVDVFKKYVHADDVVLDIGAHMGVHTVRLSQMCKKVYAFEPLTYNFDILNTNVTLNNLENVETFNVGLGAEEGKKRVLWSVNHDTGQTGFEGSDFDEGWTLPGKHVKQHEGIFNTLDSFMDVVGCVNVIKMDTEGYERHILLGGQELIQRDKPIIIYEANTPLYRELIRMMLEDWGYTVTQIRGQDFLALPQN